MSPSGQKRGFKRAPGMSAVPPIGAESLQERAARAGEGVGRWGDSDKMTQIVCTGPATGNDRRGSPQERNHEDCIFRRGSDGCRLRAPRAAERSSGQRLEPRRFESEGARSVRGPRLRGCGRGHRWGRPDSSLAGRRCFRRFRSRTTGRRNSRVDVDRRPYDDRADPDGRARRALDRARQGLPPCACLHDARQRRSRHGNDADLGRSGQMRSCHARTAKDDGQSDEFSDRSRSAQPHSNCSET